MSFMMLAVRAQANAVDVAELIYVSVFTIDIVKQKVELNIY